MLTVQARFISLSYFCLYKLFLSVKCTTVLLCICKQQITYLHAEIYLYESEIFFKSINTLAFYSTFMNNATGKKICVQFRVHVFLESSVATCFGVGAVNNQPSRNTEQNYVNSGRYTCQQVYRNKVGLLDIITGLEQDYDQMTTTQWLSLELINDLLCVKEHARILQYYLFVATYDHS